LQAAQHTIPNGRPDKAYCCGTTKAPDLQVYKKPPKYTPFSWTSWLLNEWVKIQKIFLHKVFLRISYTKVSNTFKKHF